MPTLGSGRESGDTSFRPDPKRTVGRGVQRTHRFGEKRYLTLANEGFVAKAPADVVDAEREKLAAYRAELEELGE